MANCPETPVVLRINEDLVLKLRALRVDLAKCNQDKADLRAWVDTLNK